MLSLKLLSEKENVILKKKDILLELDHKGLATPKKTDIEAKIAEHFKTDKDKVEVVYIFSDFGWAKSKIKARIWKEPIKKKEPKEEKPTEVKEGENEA